MVDRESQANTYERQIAVLDTATLALEKERQTVHVELMDVARRSNALHVEVTAQGRGPTESERDEMQALADEIHRLASRQGILTIELNRKRSRRADLIGRLRGVTAQLERQAMDERIAAGIT